VVDLETNRIVEGNEAIHPRFPISWGNPRGQAPHVSLESYYRKVQAQEKEKYWHVAPVLDGFERRVGMRYEEFVGGGGLDLVGHLIERRECLEALMPSVQGLFPRPEGERGVPDCGPWGTAPAMDENEKNWLDRPIVKNKVLGGFRAALAGVFERNNCEDQGGHSGVFGAQ